MENKQGPSKKVVLGVLLGSVVGAAALYMLYAAKNRPEPLIKRVGKTVSDIGEMLENCNFSGDEIVNKVEKSLPSGITDNIGDIIDMGLKIWKQFK